MAKFIKSIEVTAGSELEAAEKLVYLHTLVKNLNRESLMILSEKSSKAGIDKKIKDYKALM